MVYIRDVSVGSDETSLGAAHNTAKSDGLMVPPDFIVSLCSKMKTACLHHPVSVAAAGGRRGAGRGQEQGRAQGLGLFGSAWGVCALSAGGSRGEANNRPPLPKTPRSLPRPALPRRRTEPLYSPFLQNYFFSSFLDDRSEAIWGGGRSQRGSRGLLAPGSTRHCARDPRCLRPAWLRALSRYTAPGPAL